MTVKGQNFEIYQGDSRQLVVTVTDDSDSLVDLSAYDAHWVVYHPTTKELVLEKTTVSGGGITMPIPTNGEVVIDLVPADTETKLPRIYNHELEISVGDSNIYTVCVGTVSILYSKA